MIVKKLTEATAKKMLAGYFRSRRVEKRDSDGNFLMGKDGAILYEEKPCTVTGIALALGLESREELELIKDKKIKALVGRALLKVEESAEEKLFSKETSAGAKLFLSVNFKRYAEKEEGQNGQVSLGVCSVWAE